YTRIYSFTIRVNPRNEFVQPPTGKTTCWRWLLPPERLGTGGQSCKRASQVTRLNMMQGSIIFSGVHRCVTMEHLLELIKEDHLSMRDKLSHLRAPRRC